VLPGRTFRTPARSPREMASAPAAQGPTSIMADMHAFRSFPSGIASVNPFRLSPHTVDPPSRPAYEGLAH